MPRAHFLARLVKVMGQGKQQYTPQTGFWNYRLHMETAASASPGLPDHGALLLTEVKAFVRAAPGSMAAGGLNERIFEIRKL